MLRFGLVGTKLCPRALARPLLSRAMTAGGRTADLDAYFDCDGRGCLATGTACHAECEGRHLDDVERGRRDAGFRYPERPSVVVTASRDMGRTASTWVFNAVRLLYRQAREACDSYWLRRLEPGKVKDRLRTGAHVLLKTHEWTAEMSQKEFDEVRPMFSHVVVSVREGFPVDPEWMKVATHIIRFEDIVARGTSDGEAGAVRVLRGLAAHLGIQGLDDEGLRAVDYQLMTLPMPEFGCDQTTKHWHFHGRRGGRPQPTEPPTSSRA